jgi:hypothetical protein
MEFCCKREISSPICEQQNGHYHSPHLESSSLLPSPPFPPAGELFSTPQEVDFESFQAISDDEEELDQTRFKIAQSNCWPQIIAPTKYYNKVCFHPVTTFCRMNLIAN